MRTPRVIFILLLVPFALVQARAGQLPVRIYSTADGLVHERVRCVVRDSRGFLWFCTGDGLSRFDGYGFANYGVREGLAHPAVQQIAEGRGGVYWLGTTAGVALFDPAAGRATSGVAADPPAPVSQGPGKSKFTFFKLSDEELSNRVQALVEDGAGRVWAGTMGGLFYADAAHHGRRVFRRLELPATERLSVNALLEDAGGSVWAATSAGLFRRTPGGRVVAYALGPAPDSVNSLLLDREGRLWVGFRGGLAVLRPEPLTELSGAAAPLVVRASREETHRPDGRLRLPEAAGEAHVFGEEEGLKESTVVGLRETGDGRVWMATWEAMSDIVWAINPKKDRLSDLVHRMRRFASDVFTARGIRLRFDAPAGAEDLAVGANLRREVFVLTVYDDDERIFDALCAGATGYLLKRTPPARLLEALREAVTGGAPMSPEVASRVIALFRAVRPPDREGCDLTPHETRLLKLLVEGHNYTTAAAELGVSYNTVKFHMRHVYEKLQVHSKSEAVARALRDRLV